MVTPVPSQGIKVPTELPQLIRRPAWQFGEVLALLDMRSKRSLWLTLSAIPFLVFIWNSLYFSPWTVDDAFISLRYAYNLVEGNGLVYNLGERVEGFSNFSWVLLAASLMRLGLPFITVLKGIGLAAGLSTLILAYSLACRLGGDADGRFCGLLTLWFLGCNTSLAIWCQSGLETTLFAALIIGMCVRYEMEMESNRRLPWSAVLFALAWMTRPEAPLFGLYFLARRAVARRRPDRKDLWWIVSLAALVVPYEIWAYTYYGSFLPQAHAAKIGAWNWDHMRFLTRYFVAQGWGFTGLFLLALAGTIRFWKKLPPVVWAPILSGFIFVVYAGHDWMARYRFFVPIIAFQGCFIALGIVWLLRSTRHRGVLFALTATVVLVAGANYVDEQLTGVDRSRKVYGFTTVSRNWLWWRDVPKNLRRRAWPLQTTAWSILAHADPDARIMMVDIGFPGFLTMNPIWDLYGLVTPISVEFRKEFENPEVRDRFARKFIETGAATHIYLPRESGKKFTAKLENLLATHPDLQGMYRAIEPGRSNGNPPDNYLENIFDLQLPYARVLRHIESPDPTAKESLANLERRLPEVVKRFPEYEPQASKIIFRLRQSLQNQAQSLPQSRGPVHPSPH